MNAFVIPRNLGIVTGEAGTVELMPDLVRIPEWLSRVGIACRAVAAPPRRSLAWFRTSPSRYSAATNTPGEMAAKRRDYFAAGVEVVWEIDPDTRTVEVYTSPTQSTTLTAADTLDGGIALPGFTLPVQALFAELDRHG